MPPFRSLLGAAVLVAFAHTVHADVSDYDGRWTVRASCGTNATNGRPGFTERSEWTIAQGRIRETRAQTTPLGNETTTWEGRIEQGRATLEATGRRDNGDVWTWQLNGTATAPDRMTLTGGLFAQTRRVRDCTMELTALAPAANSLLGKANAAAKTPAPADKPQPDPAAKARETTPAEKPVEARAARTDKSPIPAAATPPARSAPPITEPVATKPASATIAPAADPVVAPADEPAKQEIAEPASSVAAPTPAVVATPAAPRDENQEELAWYAVAAGGVLAVVAAIGWALGRRRRAGASRHEPVATTVDVSTHREQQPVPMLVEPVKTAPEVVQAAPVVAAAPAPAPVSPEREVAGRTADDAPAIRALETRADVLCEPAAPAAADPGPEPAAAPGPRPAPRPEPPPAPEAEPKPRPVAGPDGNAAAWHRPAALVLVFAIALLASGVSLIQTLQCVLVIALCVAAYRPAWLPANVVERLTRDRMKAILAVVAVELYYTLEAIFVRTLGKYGGKVPFPWFWITVAVALSLAVYLLHKYGDAE